MILNTMMATLLTEPVTWILLVTAGVRHKRDTLPPLQSVSASPSSHHDQTAAASADLTGVHCSAADNSVISSLMLLQLPFYRQTCKLYCWIDGVPPPLKQ